MSRPAQRTQNPRMMLSYKTDSIYCTPYLIYSNIGALYWVILPVFINRLTFNPKWHNQIQSVFTWEIELRTVRSRRMKISSPIETRFRFMYRPSYFSVILALVRLSMWTKLLFLQTIVIVSAIMNVDFIPSFIPEWNLGPSLHDSESKFRFGTKIRNEKWNELDLEWVVTQSGFMWRNVVKCVRPDCNSVWIHANTP